LLGGNVGSGGVGTLVLAGGTQGGVLAGAGTVAVQVANGGWVEPQLPGLTFDAGYQQAAEGNLLLPEDVWQSSTPLLSIAGPNLSLNGSLWCLG
jgi:hypothetical protein